MFNIVFFYLILFGDSLVSRVYDLIFLLEVCVFLDNWWIDIGWNWSN